MLTALPIGLLFGFFLHKGELCGAAAFSEVLVLRDGRKLFGFWIAIVATMASMIVLDRLGWVTLNPKPLTWLNYILGGVCFGVGIVLAGGCVSGCLFKAAAGNLNSMAALPGIMLGVALMENGPLGAWTASLNKAYLIKSSEGRAVTLASSTGRPYWLLAAVAIGLTVALILVLRSRRKSASPSASRKTEHEHVPALRRWLTRPWKPWQAGLAIGLLAFPAYLSSVASGRNYPLGVTNGMISAHTLIANAHHRSIYQKAPKPAAPKVETMQASVAATATAGVKAPPKMKVTWWLVALVSSLLAGSWVSAKMSGVVKLLPKPPEQTVIAFFGGILVGAGAKLGAGGMIGNVLSGTALLSAGSILFAIVVLLSSWAATYFYLMGGGMRRSARN